MAMILTPPSGASDGWCDVPPWLAPWATVFRPLRGLECRNSSGRPEGVPICHARKEARARVRAPGESSTAALVNLPSFSFGGLRNGTPALPALPPAVDKITLMGTSLNTLLEEAPQPPVGTMAWCCDCAINAAPGPCKASGSTCASGSAGAFATRINSTWSCGP